MTTGDLTFHWRKIVWALDPAESELITLGGVERMVESFIAHGVQVQPVYLLRPTELNLPLELSPAWPGLMQEYASNLEKVLGQRLGHPRLKGVLAPRAVPQAPTSVTHAADLLSQISEDLNADMILVTTHGRGGLRRMMLGSFTETLMARSQLPVLVLGPHLKSKNVGWPKRILFATDLSDESKGVYRKLLEIAAPLQAELMLFHSVTFPFQPVLQSGVFLLGGGWVPIESNFGEVLQRQERKIQAWTRWGRSRGAKVAYRLSMEGGTVWDSVLKVGEETDRTLIAIEARSGAFSASLLGSITRQVVRGATCPVWVFPVRGLVESPSRATDSQAA